MNGELAQLIALAAHGNAFLSSVGNRPAQELVGSNSTFQYVRDVRFTCPDGSLGLEQQAKTVAGSTAAWFDHLRLRGGRRLAVVVFYVNQKLPAHVAAAFSGGGPWAIQAEYENGLELWKARWTPNPEEPTADRRWSVQYEAIPLSESVMPAPVPLADATSRLSAIVKEAGEFSTAANLGFWAEWFVEARQLLASDEPVPPYHPNMLPPQGYSLPARQLLAAATRAWVLWDGVVER